MKKHYINDFLYNYIMYISKNYVNKEKQNISIKFTNKIPKIDDNATKLYNDIEYIKRRIKKTDDFSEKIQEIHNRYEKILEKAIEKSKFENMNYNIMKIIEILYTFPELTKNNITGFHNYDLPGIFILAISYYLSIKSLKNIKYEWYGLDNLGEKKIIYDEYGLYNLNKFRWLMDENNDGNLMYKDCIEYNANKFKKLCPSGCNLFTSFLGADDENAGMFQERIDNPYHYSQILLAFKILNKGGNMILRMYSSLLEGTISLIYFISNYFDKIVFMKPQMSRIHNSEIFLICFGYNPKDFSGLYPVQKILTDFMIKPECKFYKNIPEDLRNYLLEINTKIFELNMEYYQKIYDDIQSYTSDKNTFMNVYKKKYDNDTIKIIGAYFSKYPYFKCEEKNFPNIIFTKIEKNMEKSLLYKVDIQFKKIRPINTKKIIRIINLFSGCLIEDNMVEILKKYLNKDYSVYEINIIDKDKYIKNIDKNIDDCEMNIFINYHSPSYINHAKKNILYINGIYKVRSNAEMRNIDEIYCSSKETYDYEKNEGIPLKFLQYEYLKEPEFVYYKYEKYTVEKERITKNIKPIIIYLDNVGEGLLNIIKKTENPVYVAIGKYNTRTITKLDNYGKVKKVITLPKNYYNVYYPPQKDMDYFLDYFRKNKKKIITHSLINSNSVNKFHNYLDKIVIDDNEEVYI